MMVGGKLKVALWRASTGLRKGVCVRGTRSMTGLHATGQPRMTFHEQSLSLSFKEKKGCCFIMDFRNIFGYLCNYADEIENYLKSIDDDLLAIHYLSYVNMYESLLETDQNYNTMFLDYLNEIKPYVMDECARRFSESKLKIGKEIYS